MKTKLDTQILQQTLTLNGEVFTFGEIVAVDDTNLSHEYSVQGARMAYIGAELAEMEYQHDLAKAKRDEIYAIIDADVRDQHVREAKKITEAGIKSMILADEEYIEAQAVEIGAKRNYNLLRHFHTALRQRGEMLISLGATRRQEYEMTDMKIREAKAALSD